MWKIKSFPTEKKIRPDERRDEVTEKGHPECLGTARVHIHITQEELSYSRGVSRNPMRTMTVAKLKWVLDVTWRSLSQSHRASTWEAFQVLYPNLLHCHMCVYNRNWRFTKQSFPFLCVTHLDNFYLTFQSICCKPQTQCISYSPSCGIMGHKGMGVL